MANRFDVTSLGSTMIRLSVPPGERIETAQSFAVRTAGTESNTMAALARMGFGTAWLSRLNDNPLGKRIANDIRMFGVDVSGIVWTDSDRNELFFVEYGAAPRPIQVTYDRGHSAVSQMKLSDVDLDLLLDTKVLHMSGIFAALSDGCAQLSKQVIQAAVDRNVKVSFDVNYRSKLWSPAEALQVLDTLLPLVDILILTKEDAQTIFELDDTPANMITALHQKYKPELTVMTLGSEGGILYDGKSIVSRSGYPATIVDRLGAGDCFTAGIMCGYLEGSVEMGLEYATAMAALKLSMSGDYFVSDRNEVMVLINSEGGREVGR